MAHDAKCETRAIRSVRFSGPESLCLTHDCLAVYCELEATKTAKDGAYAERNKLVAFISKIYPASLERHDENDKTWENDWRWIVFIDSPCGQVSWHIHDSELPMFAHLPRGAGREWDGHTTEDKYARLSAYVE
jgi:hypothetical protein